MMTKVIFTLAASLLAGAALAQSGAQVHASAATDAAKPVPPASASVSASAATDAARSGASAKASAATDTPRVIPQARKTKQPAAEAGKPVK
jgi:ABC-type oligopeptide transport system substrate-binding subunit